MAGGIVQYKASDGSDVKLSSAIVAKYIITGGQDVEEREIYSFIAKCQARKLNPLAGDAYMTCFKGRASVIVSKDYFMRTATQQPGYDGMSAGVVVIDRKGVLTYRQGCIYGKQTEKLVGGWAEVYDKTRSHPSRAEVSLEEYDQHRSLWLTKPATMIRKVAIVQALREAYPGAYGGIYDRDEMPEPDSPEVPRHETAEDPSAIGCDVPSEVYETEDQEEPDAADRYEGAEEVTEADVYDHDLDF